MLQGDWSSAIARIPAIDWRTSSTMSQNISNCRTFGDDSTFSSRDEATLILVEQKYLELVKQQDFEEALKCLRRELAPLLSRMDEANTVAAELPHRPSSHNSSTEVSSEAVSLLFKNPSTSFTSRAQLACQRESRLHALAAFLVYTDFDKDCKDGVISEVTENCDTRAETSYLMSTGSISTYSPSHVSSSSKPQCLDTAKVASVYCNSPIIHCDNRNARRTILKRVKKLMAPSESCGSVPEGRLQQLLFQAIDRQVERCMFHNPRILKQHGARKLVSTMSLFDDHSCGRESIPNSCLCVLGSDSHAITSEIWAISFSPDGRYLASSSTEGAVILWDTSSIPYRRLCNLRMSSRNHGAAQSQESANPHTNQHIHTLLFSSDGHRLLACGKSRIIFCWILVTSMDQVQQSELSKTSEVHNESDEHSSSSIVNDKTAPRYETFVNKVERDNRNSTLPCLDEGIVPLSFELMTLGKLVDEAEEEEQRLATEKPTRDLIRIQLQDKRTHTKSVTGISFLDSRGRHCLSASLDKSILFWDIDKGSCTCVWKCDSRIIGFAVSDDKRTAVLICADQSIIVLQILFGEGKCNGGNADETNWEEVKCRRKIQLQKKYRDIFTLGPLVSMTLSADGQRVLLSYKKIDSGKGVNASHRTVEKYGLLCWHVEDRRVLASYEGHMQEQYMIQPCFGGHDDVFVVSGSEDAQIFLWHRETGCPGAILKGHHDTVNAVAWNPADPHVFVSASDDSTLRVWGTESFCS